MSWVVTQLTQDSYTSMRREPNAEALSALQVTLRLETPLDWSQGAESALESVFQRIQRDSEFALDVIDYLIQRAEWPAIQEIEKVLVVGGSEWEVARPSRGRPHLAKRVVGPVGEMIKQIQSDAERAHHHLSTAWEKLVGRNPDPSTAYKEAIRAVEAVAKPVVTPDDSDATLGKIIQALRDKPEKWNVILDQGTVEQVANMASLVWKGQLDRHGTDDPAAPLNVSQEEADAAVHIAISLTRLFSSGGITRVLQ
ncbi:MAG: hypothetical protein ACTHNY_05125 [Solirubrobacterales bacterium]